MGALAFSRSDLAASEAALYEARYGHLGVYAILEAALRDLYAERIALVSSFGADSAVLLHLVSEIDPSTAVIFLDTGKHFGETRRYRDLMAERLGLTNLRSQTPNRDRLAEADPDGGLWARDPDRCCAIRKSEPLEAVLGDFDAWITGRKRFQTDARRLMRVFEADGERVKVNPLSRWSAADILDYRERHRLPAHPLVAEGFPSIGCMPCTSRVRPGEDARSGRWAGRGKNECGIHLVSSNPTPIGHPSP